MDRTKNKKKFLLLLITLKKEMDFSGENAYEHIETVDDYDSGYVEWLAYELNKKYHFTHIISLTEGDVIRVARIREKLGILGENQSIESGLRYRDKFVMKQILLNNGLSVPNFASVESVTDLLKFVEARGYPVVVKPRKGYGSINTAIIKNDDDLFQYIQKYFHGHGLDNALDFEVESFINGQMFHIDGIVINGEVKIVWPSKYVNTVVDFEKNPFIAGFTLSNDNPVTHRLQSYIVDVIKALGGPKCFPFHAEAWHTVDDDIVLCEIASRGGGGGIKLEIKEAFGLDMDRTWSQFQCEDYITNRDLLNEDTWETIKPEQLTGWIYIYPHKGKLLQIPDDCKEDYCLGFIPYATNDTEFKDRTSCFDAVASILVKGDTEEEVEKNINRVYSWWEQNTKWEIEK